jgi:predicted RNA binding protein YcfA (HicA-like mRNA interferase family)
MKLPRDLSGAELIKLLCKHHGYRRVNQEGSHVILETDSPRHHRLAILAPSQRPTHRSANVPCCV